MNKFLHYFDLIPDLKSEGYFADSCFLNYYGEGNPIRVGCKYSGVTTKDNKEVSQQLMIITEVFEKEPKIEKFETEQLQNNEIYYGYVPSFQMAQDVMQTTTTRTSTSLSWKEGNKVFTLVSLRPRETETSSIEELPTLPSYDDSVRDALLKESFKMIVRTKQTLNLQPLLNLVAYLPPSVRDWQLVTTFLFSQTIRMGGTKVEAGRWKVEGNYQNGEKYIKLSFAYVPLCEPHEFEESLTASANRTTLLKAIHTIEDHYVTLIFHSKQQNCVIFVSNNETTRKFAEYEGAMKELILEAIDAFNKFNTRNNVIG